jgi:hypothetical protein
MENTMSDKLLTEAVAEAKKIVQLAEASARVQLAQEFQPRIASIVSKKLRETGNVVESSVSPAASAGQGSVGGKGNYQDTSKIGGTQVTVDNPGPTDPSKQSWDSSNVENPGQEVDDYGKGPTHKDPVKEAFGDRLDDRDPRSDDDNTQGQMDGGDGLDAAGDSAMAGGNDDIEKIDLDIGGDADRMDPDGRVGVDDFDVTARRGDDHQDELDLEAIIRELEADTMGTGMATEGSDGMKPIPGRTKFDSGDANDNSKNPVQMGEDFDDPMAGAKVRGPISAIRGATGGIREAKSDVNAFEDQNNGVPAGKEVQPGQEVTTEAQDVYEDLEEILREMDAEETTENKIATENAELKENLNKHRQVIHYLNSKLQEVNMLNSKLMFTTKLFREFNLNEKDKTKIIESFDRATTPRETKLLYSTLHEVFVTRGIGKETKKSSNTVKNITEGMASATVGSTKPKAVLTEVVKNGEQPETMRERFMRNAGITVQKS